jgi:two-component system, NarL family, sensor kinase
MAVYFYICNMKNLLLVFITGTCILTSCRQKEKKPLYKNANEDWVWGKKNLSPKFTWLRNHKEYESQHFKDSFYTYYNDYVKKENIDSASHFLDYYSGQLNMLEAYDTLLCQTENNFIATYKNSANADVRYLLPGIVYHLAAQYQFKGDMDSAIYWNNFIASCADAIPVTKSFAMQNNAALYLEKGKLDMALPMFISAAEFSRQGNAPIPESMNYAMIGNTYGDLGAYDEAVKYYDLAINKMIIEKEVPDQVDFYYQKIKMLYNNTKDTTAIIVTADSLEACKKPILERYLSKSRSYLYRINTALYYKYECLNKPDSSNWYLQQCKQLADSIKNKGLKTDFAILTFENELKYKKKVSDEKKLLEITEKQVASNSLSTAEVLYGFLADNANKNNPSAALNYYKKQKEIQDKRLALNNKGKLFELVEKYETEKKEQQIILQKEELKNKNKTIALLFAALGFIGFAALAYRYWQSRKKLKIEKQMSENYTRQLLEKTEEERKRIATDLHDSISHELMGLKNSNTEGFKQVNQKIDTIINDIRIISRNLHPIMFDKVGLQNTIEQMAERVQQQNEFLLTSDINYANSLSAATELQIYRIIQEAINNIVKYANAIAGKISITETDTQVIVEIKDNGKGFDVAHTLNSSKAFGLHNIIERSKAIGGKANIASGNAGTVINIVIPKK